MEHGPFRNVVDLPMNSMVVFHSYGSLPEGNYAKDMVYLDLNGTNGNS